MAAFEMVEMGADLGRAEINLGDVVVIVAYVLEDLFMHVHCFGMGAHGSIHLGAERFHLERGWVQWAPYAAEVVANVFEKANCGEMGAVAEFDFNKASADPDGVGGRPGVLLITIFPELSEDPLYRLVDLNISRENDDCISE